ncbi:MAG: hypothetical protein RLZZ292_1276 [Bacteroidota bacterium]|jgi:hypothetical protein
MENQYSEKSFISIIPVTYTHKTRFRSIELHGNYEKVDFKDEGRVFKDVMILGIDIKKWRIN